jgi:hypothetical protein
MLARFNGWGSGGVAMSGRFRAHRTLPRAEQIGAIARAKRLKFVNFYLLCYSHIDFCSDPDKIKP